MGSGEKAIFKCEMMDGEEEEDNRNPMADNTTKLAFLNRAKSHALTLVSSACAQYVVDFLGQASAFTPLSLVGRVGATLSSCTLADT